MPTSCGATSCASVPRVGVSAHSRGSWRSCHRACPRRCSSCCTRRPTPRAHCPTSWRARPIGQRRWRSTARSSSTGALSSPRRITTSRSSTVASHWTTAPRRNRVRPAVDVLFRSAAASCGARVIGVVLTGHLADGSSGARAIKRAGGVLVVQSPYDAEAPSMPQSAIEAATPDYVVPLAAMGELLRALVGTLAPRIEVPEASIQGDGHAHERGTAPSSTAHSASSIASSSPCEPETPANDVQSTGPRIRR